MKRFLILLLVLSLLLCACGTQSAETPSAAPTEASTQKSTEAPTQEPTENTTEAPTEVPTEAPTEPLPQYRNPLNGERLAEPYTGRPAAVVINNIQAALPQYGISQADFMYELVTEGGITRYLAIFSDPGSVGTLGPVRSARTFFSNIALSYDAPLFHCGGSAASLQGQLDASGATIDNWNHINEQYNWDYFFRDRSRLESGYALEHTLFTNGERMMQALEAKGYTEHTDRFLALQPEQVNYGLQFADEITLSGESAKQITVNFLYGKTTTLNFDPGTGLYEAQQYGRDHIDAGNGQTMAYRNVIVLYTEQLSIYDGTYYRSYYNLTGSGTGHFACNGQIVPIQWHRDDYRGSFTYTLEDGTPITLGSGATYVGIVSTLGSIDCE